MDSCLLCRNADVRIEREIPTEEIAGAWARALGYDIRSELGDIDSLRLMNCTQCSLRFFLPLLPGSSRMYAHLETFDWYRIANRWEHRAAMRDLSGRVLEVGCGSGSFLAHAAGLRIEGIDLNPDAVASAQRAGLPARVMELADADTGYDAVCAFQTLEHIEDPRAFLESCCGKLKPGGRLVITVPNGESYLRDQFNVLDMPPHHLSRWSVRTLESIGDPLPLRLDRISREPLARYHVRDFVQTRTPRLLRTAARLALAAGLRHFVTGHTLYASFTRR